MFYKKDLKAGMLVQVRSKNWYVILNQVESTDKIMSMKLDGLGYADLGTNNDDLTDNNSNFDVMKVITPETGFALIDVIKGEKQISQISYTVNYERQEEDPKVKQLEELINKLNTQLNDAQAELKSIKEAIK